MKERKLPRWTPVVGFLLLCALALSLFFQYTRFEGDVLPLTPYLSDANGWDIYTLEDGKRLPLDPTELSGQTGTVYLERTVEPDWEAAGYTYLELSGWEWQYSLFLDGHLFFTTTPAAENTLPNVTFPADYTGVTGIGETVRATLPPGSGGKRLTAALRSVFGGGVPMFFLTSGEIETGSDVALANRLGMPAAAFGVAALGLLGLFFYTQARDRRDWPLLLLALAAACQSLYWLREFGLRFSVSFPLSIPLATIFPQLFLLLPLIYLITLMGRYRQWCALAVGLLGTAALLRSVWDALPHPSWLYDVLMLSCAAAALVFAALEAAGGSKVFRLFFTAAGLLCGVFLFCCLISRRLGNYTALALTLTAGGDIRFLLPVLGVGLFLVCAYLSAHQAVRAAADEQTELELLAARDALLRENLRLMDESGTALAQARHDMLGHLGILQALSQEGAYEKLDEYLSRLTRQTGEILPLKISAHPIVNAILTQRAERAKNAGVALRCQVELPETLSIPDEELSAFLMNLLDNALDAAEAIPAPRPRWVEITMHLRGKYLFIEGRNTYAQIPEPEEEGGRFRSTKGAGHGYGLKIMEGVAHRYQSELHTEAGEGVFTARTALLLPME